LDWRMRQFILILFLLSDLSFADTDYLCPDGRFPRLDATKHLMCSNTTGPTPVPTLPPPTPQPTFAYVAPTPQIIPTSVPTPFVPTPAPTLVPPTPQPTFNYVAPTPAPTPTRAPALTAVYNPASIAANTTLNDAVTVTGIVTGRPVIANPGVNLATGCIIAGVWASATNTITIQWRNAFAATTACDTASSTWTFVQP
jgi:hypothetical protein